MNSKEHNRKVAISRWNKVLESERKSILNTDEGLVLKAAICGFLAGDGSITIRKQNNSLHCETRFYPDDEQMLNAYLDAVKKVYGKLPSVSKIKNKKKMFYVRITSKTMTEDLVDLTDFGLYKWNPPENLFSVHGAKEAWLRAFFSAEAYVGPNHIKIQTVNKEGMEKVSKLLSDLDIMHNAYHYIPKNSMHSVIYILVIGRKEARKMFYKKIGFYHSKKTESLKKSLGL